MNKKFYIIIIVVLVILNIFSWRIWWDGPKPMLKQQQKEGEFENKRRGGGKNYFFNKLELSQQQKSQFEQNSKHYFKQIEVVKDSMNVIRSKMMLSFKEGNDSVLQQSILKEMANYKLQLEVLTMEHFNGLRNICNEEQIEVFDSLLVRMVEHSPMFKDGMRGRGKHHQERDEKRNHHQ
ncbi:Spy/CpxP family protein refolding chaperone [Labilibacter marinus]|uniref:Spy/CpxP family protein refolding chaperone n=1 Tax=Labilibacter marinus TaxID=1477105 RepID=UPI00082F6FC6|nr:hypothetical protein [Labilibacter marinus]